MAMAVLAATAYGHVERSCLFGRTRRLTRASSRAGPGGKVPKARTLGSRAQGEGARRHARGLSARLAEARDQVDRQAHIGRAGCSGRRRAGGSSRRGNARRLKRQNRAFREALLLPEHPGRDQALAQQRNGVVVMPGKYIEPKSRAKPTNDPKCAQYKEESEKGAGRRDVQVPGEVPERPEPDLHPGPKARQDAAAEPATRGPPRDSGQRQVHPLQPPDRRHGREAGGRASSTWRRTPTRSCAAGRRRSRTWASAPTAPTAS